MPGTYLPGEHDLVGVITGVVDKEQAILGHHIKAGDSVLALPSNGLHTNGYSLARHLFFTIAKKQVSTYLDELGTTIGESLLQPHINYTQPVHTLLQQGIAIKGMAHITGGGLIENIPRILPTNCAVEIKQAALPSLAIFNVLQAIGQLDRLEMYRTFNMGVGLVLIVAKEEVVKIKQVLAAHPKFPCYEIGTVIPGSKEVRLI